MVAQGLLAMHALNLSLGITPPPPVARLVDVRTQIEYTLNGLPGAVHLNAWSADLRKILATWNKRQHYKLYCHSGRRSAQVRKVMEDMGFHHVEDLGSLARARELMNRKR